MEEKFTQFVTFGEIETHRPDILSDAFGIEALTDMLLSSAEPHLKSPDERVITSLFEKIRKDAKVH